MNRRWSAWKDALFWGALAAYALNRWGVRPWVQDGWLRFHANDFLLIPVLLPPVLMVHQWLGWRRCGEAPRPLETGAHLVFWCAAFEWIAPAWFGKGTADWRDAVHYCLGAFVAQGWWSWFWGSGRLSSIGEGCSGGGSCRQARPLQE